MHVTLGLSILGLSAGSAPLRATAVLAILAGLWLAGPAQATADEAQQVLRDGTWVCSSPEAYDQAIAAERDPDGKSFGALKAELLERKLCIYINGGDIEDMMAPWVTVTDRRGDKVKVVFTIEFYKKIAFLHRNITRVTFTGWTDKGNLRSYYDWLNQG